RKPQDRKSGAPSRFTKDKIEKVNNKGSSEKPRLVRCHECQGIGHYRNECPSYKKNQRKGKGKTLVVSLTDNESETSDRQESSSSDDEGNYMAFVATVKSESDKESDKVEEEHSNDNSGNEDEDEDDIDLQEAYQQLFKESLKIKKVNKALLKKVDELEREKEKLGSKLQESLKSDNLLGMNKPVGDKRGLGYVEGNTTIAGPSKTVFVAASKSNAVRSPSKGKSVPREQSQQSRRNIRTRYPQTCTFEPRFIPTCHHCGALGHTRPRCYKLGNERRSQNILSQVSFLSNQMSHLTEMLTRLTKSMLSSKKVWVKKSDLGRPSGRENCFVAHIALKAQNSNMWYLDSACSRHMCDGGSAPILGKGTVQMHGLPKRCIVYDSSGRVVFEGVRTSDNCYG
ncbi:uncharacterized protein LOC111382568, partial [Olea europaea var. sylvestris]|uniref:uncharacterized protein LOC111382568 n=1 Tax=Olea europaea var. sylvestris TaxID=158386 RepID=UPI000C1D5DEF